MRSMRTSGRTANNSAPPASPEVAAETAVGSTAADSDADALASVPAARGRVREPAPEHKEPGTGEGAAMSTRNSDFVQSLDRGLAVIRAFGPDRERLSLSDVAKATGLTRAAARRFLLTLVKLGYVRNDGREFSLRPRVLELGYAYLSGLALPEVAAPHMEELVARLHESSSISVLDGLQIVYVVRVPTKRIMTVAISVGTRFPAYATSMGRVLLADLPEDELERYLAEATFERLTAHTVTQPGRVRSIVREVAGQGYAIVDQELEEGLRAVAAPIRGAADVGTAAINVSAHASRVSMAAMRGQILPALLETARQIEADLRAQSVTG
jgi:IclR family transcriptional regulator, pca regulon regulatory protein